MGHNGTDDQLWSFWWFYHVLPIIFEGASRLWEQYTFSTREIVQEVRWCSAVPRVPRPGIGPPPWPQVPSMAVERNFIVAILVVWCAAAGRENWASQGLTWKRRETYCMNAYASYLMRMQNIYCILYWIYVYMYIDVCNLLFLFLLRSVIVIWVSAISWLGCPFHMNLQ